MEGRNEQAKIPETKLKIVGHSKRLFFKINIQLNQSAVYFLKDVSKCSYD